MKPWFFRDPTVAKEYFQISSESKVRITRIFLILILFNIIAYLVLIALGKTSASLVLCIAYLVIIILTIIFIKKLDKLAEHIGTLILASGIIYVLWIVKQEWDEISKINGFYTGYCFGFLQQLFLARMQNYVNLLTFDISLLIFRLIIFLPNESTFTFPLHIILDILCVASVFDKIREDRKIFQTFYFYRKGHDKFKQLIVKSLPQGVSVLNKAKNFIFRNLSHEMFFGDITKDQVQNHLKSFKIEEKSIEVNYEKNSGTSKVVSAANMDEILDFLLKKDSNVENISFHATLDIKDSFKIFTARCVPIFWDEARAISIILNDITHQDTITKLKISENNKDKFISSISHELRTPLNAITGFLRIIDETDELPDDVKVKLHLMRVNCDILSNIINCILDIQLIQSGRMKLNFTLNYTDFLTESMIDMFQFQANYKGLEFRTSIAPNVPDKMQTDFVRIHQILVNLLVNALKFTRSGIIFFHIGYDEDNAVVVFNVRDTGIGISEDKKASLCRMFGGESDKSTSTQGIGLGLYTANELAKLLNRYEKGLIIESELDSGSTFSFWVSTEMEFPSSVVLQDVNEDESFDDNSLLIQSMTKYVMIDKKLMPRRTTVKELSKSFRSINSSKFSRKVTFSSMLESVKVSVSERPVLRKSPLVTEEDRLRKENLILLVDDAPFNLLVAQHYFERFGYKNIIAYNGQEAIEKILEHQDQGRPFSLIFMDLQMPVMDGFEATRRIKKMMADGLVRTAPIIALSANDSEHDKQRCWDCGMEFHISKPLKEKDLIFVLNKYLK